MSYPVRVSLQRAGRYLGLSLLAMAAAAVLLSLPAQALPF